MKVFETKDIRNIAFIGSAKSGKTTLTESMLYHGKVLHRRGTVEQKNTASDYRPIELEKGNSVVTSVLHTFFDNTKINILDTPGSSDYIGELITSLYAADTAVMTVNASNGIEVGNEIGWRYATQSNIPTLFLANFMDHENVKFEELIQQLKTYFSDKVIAAQYPVNVGPDFDAIVDLVLNKMLKFDGEGNFEVLDIPEEEKERAQEMQLNLIEAAAEGSEELMEKYFENETLSLDEMRKGLNLGLQNRAVFPVFVSSAKKDIGVSRLMEFIKTSTPSPLQAAPVKTKEGEELHYNAEDPFTAQIFKTSIESHLGDVAFMKIMAGKISEGQDVINGKSGNKERVSQLYVMAGKNREKVEQAVAGDIVATIKLKESKINITLNDNAVSDRIVEPVEFPNPLYTTAIKAANNSDDEKMGTFLQDIVNMDHSLDLEYSKELRQIILRGMGEQHINSVKWVFEHVHNIPIELYTAKIPYRETITKKAKSSYRHKKQSGGAGQFGEVYMMIEPYHENKEPQKEFPIRKTDEYELDWGGKLIYNSCIVGGAIDAKFMPAILKGIMEKLEIGPLTGSYARDIVVNVYDGKMHPVDSNEVSFKIAGRMSFSDAFKKAGPQILEPIYDMVVIVPEEKMGDVMTDLQGRRAIIMGMEGEGIYQHIKAKVPLAEVAKYSTALNSLTSGRAFYTLDFAEYAPVPGDVQEKLLKEYEESQKEEG
ncbi:MAG: elongation factor G [Bacteroidales bacterium]